MATDCPEDVLLNSPCNIKRIKTEKKARYFICSTEGLCTDESLKLYTYIFRYRDGDTSITKESKGTAFFGSPSGPSRRFCYKGKIWDGLE